MGKPMPLREELILVAVMHIKQGILLEKIRYNKLQIPGKIFYKNTYAKNVAGEVAKEKAYLMDTINDKIIFRNQDKGKIEVVVKNAFGIYDFRNKHRRIKAFYAPIKADSVNLEINSNFVLVSADKNIISQSRKILPDAKCILLDFLTRQESIMQNDNFCVIPVQAVA